MQKAHAKDGLVVMAVATDDPKDKKTHAATVALLDKLEAPFRTVQLDLAKKEWVKKFRMPDGSWPGVFVFNREGKYVLKLPTYDKEDNVKDEVDYDKVKKAVREETRKK
jgi:thioredoxin-related protein